MANRVINKGIEQVAIDLLKHHPRNANHGDVEAIKTSLAVNGWYGSVVANLTTIFPYFNEISFSISVILFTKWLATA